MEQSNNPRMWWIETYDILNNKCLAHVIEMSAYDALQAENEEYRKTIILQGEEVERLKSLLRGTLALSDKYAKHGLGFLHHSKLGDEIRQALEQEKKSDE